MTPRHTAGKTSRDETSAVRQAVQIRYCGWCGARLGDNGRVGRRKRYCGQSCRQRAYERRLAVEHGGVPDGAVVLSAEEVSALQDKLFQLRCAAEDVVTAVADGATPTDLRSLADELARAAKDVEQLR